MSYPESLVIQKDGLDPVNLLSKVLLVAEASTVSPSALFSSASENPIRGCVGRLRMAAKEGKGEKRPVVQVELMQ